MEDDRTILIPPEMSIAVVKRSQSRRAYMTRYGETKADLKRIDNIRRSTSSEPIKTTNDPLVGFSLAQGEEASSEIGTVSVLDPRGFTVQISIQNLLHVLEVSTIDKGEILDECVWGMRHNYAMLIPVTSKIYERAADNSKRVTESISSRVLVPGSIYQLRTGEYIYYYGRGYPYGYKTDCNFNTFCPSNNIENENLKNRVLESEEIKKFGDSKLFWYEVIPNDKMNDDYKSGQPSTSGRSYVIAKKTIQVSRLIRDADKEDTPKSVMATLNKALFTGIYNYRMSSKYNNCVIWVSDETNPPAIKRVRKAIEFDSFDDFVEYTSAQCEKFSEHASIGQSFFSTYIFGDGDQLFFSQGYWSTNMKSFNIFLNKIKPNSDCSSELEIRDIASIDLDVFLNDNLICGNYRYDRGYSYSSSKFYFLNTHRISKFDVNTMKWYALDSYYEMDGLVRVTYPLSNSVATHLSIT